VIRVILPISLVVAFTITLGTAEASNAQAPAISYDCTPAPTNCSGWFRASVTLTWHWDSQNGTKPVAGDCFVGPAFVPFTVDTRGSTSSCKVSNSLGTVTTGLDVIVRVDRTPPAVLAPAPSRPADYHGWFNHPVGLAFRGSDATSGIASCSRLTFSGPQGGSAPVRGTCRDVAGNSATRSFPINYDTTPPRPPRISVLPGNRSVTLSWKQSRSTVTVQVVRRRAGRQRLVFAGRRKAFKDRRLRNGRRYGYRVVAIDRAGNRATASLLTKPTSSKLLSPYKNAHVGRPPMLRWKRTRHARFYNVQLWRGGKKVLSRWPHGPGLQLHRRWGFGGKHRRLARGRYRWYVWPHGSRRYGKRLGASSFVVVR
jgi:hypothetical protein